MRHRITYIHAETAESPVKATSPTSVQLSDSTVFEREDRFSFPSPRYPHISSLRIHISSGSRGATFPSPLAYNYQYGLHVYALPNSVSTAEQTEAFFSETNDVLSEILGITVDRSSWILSLNSFYFHSPSVPSPRVHAVGEFPERWTDFDYLYQAARAVVKTFTPESQNLLVDASKTDSYTEVGVFSVTHHSTADDLVLSGGLAVFNDGNEPKGEDEKVLQKTLFHVKPRQRRAGVKYDVEYKRNGLHPIVLLPPSSAPVDADISNCDLYAYLTLEKSVFLDPYQLPDSLTLLTNYGTKNLELPEYLVESWGNEILLEINQTHTSPIELTLHSRYQLPGNKSQHTVPIASPMVFYACDVAEDVFLLKNSPFDNKNAIGGSFEKFFTEETVFYHVSERGSFSVDIPVASENSNVVNLVTFASLLFGVWLIVSSMLARVSKKKTE